MSRHGLKTAKASGRKPQKPYHTGPTLYFIGYLKSGRSLAIVSRYMVEYLHHPHMETMALPDEAEAAHAIECDWTTSSREQLLAVTRHLENFYQVVPYQLVHGANEIEQISLDESHRQLNA